MSGEIVYLLEATPLDAGGVARTVCFSQGLYNEAELSSTGNKYPVRLSQAYTHETSVFEDNIPGQTNISLGSATVNNVDGRFDFLLTYAWDARPVTIKRGKQGAAYGTYVTEFVGSTTELTADSDNLVFTLRDNSYKLAKPVQANKYAGTTGAEGGSDLQGKTKPLLFGTARNLSPVWVDTVLLTAQIHDGTITSVSAVYDRGNKLTFYQNYATYALLIAATIPPGYYATSLATGFIRVGAPPAGVLTLDAVGALGSVTNIPELAKQILLTRLGLSSGELDTSAFTQASTDASWLFEGIYFAEPDTLQYDELMETLSSSVNGFWYVTRAGLISFKIFKFSTPVVTIRQEDIMNLGKAPSPKPLFRVKVNYSKNPTVQPPSDFPIPRQLLNAYLDKEFHFVDITGTPDYSGAGKFNVFLNNTQVNDTGLALFSVPNGESWITIDTLGNIAVTSSGVASATATLRVNIGEFVWEEPFTLIRDSVAPLQKIDLSLSADRFIYNDSGQPTPTSQTITITATGTNTTAPITVTAADNLGNNVVVTGGTIPIANISSSPLVTWVTVTAKDANLVTQKKRFIVQRGLDAIASGITSSTGGNWDTNIINKPPTTLIMETFNYSTISKFNSRWNILVGSGVELTLGLTDTAVAGGSYARFGNNSGNDQVTMDFTGSLVGPGARSPDISYDSTALYEISFFVRRISGSGTVFLGLEGIAADGVTRVNTAGADSSTSQHYVAASGAAPTSAWTFYKGYMKGKSPTPDGAVHNDPASPGTMHDNTVFIRPIIVVNSSGAAGQTDVAFVRLRRINAARSGSSLEDSSGTTLTDPNIKNSAVSITSGGALTGAGGGTVTFRGIAPLERLLAAENLLDMTDWYVGGPVNDNTKQFCDTNFGTLTSALISGTGPFGDQEAIWRCSCANDGTSNFDGGWVNAVFSDGFDKTKTHIYIVWVKRDALGNYFYFGPQTTGVGAETVESLAGVADNNPYFANGEYPNGTGDVSGENGKWYLWVGVVHGYGSGVAAYSGVAGIYDPTSGVKLKNLTEFRYRSTATTSAHRAFMYPGTVGATVYGYLARPTVFRVTGRFSIQGYLATIGAVAGTNLRDSTNAVLNDSAVKNSAVSITSGGALTGAGGGTVTYGGLGGGNVGLQSDLRLGGAYMKDSGGTVLTDAGTKNSAVSITSGGALTGAGGGTVTYSGLGGGNVGLQSDLRLGGSYLKDSGGTVLTDSSTKNSAVSITSGGVLTGAGGGTVTIGGLGYTGDLNAGSVVSLTLQSNFADMSISGNKVSLDANAGWTHSAYALEPMNGTAFVQWKGDTASAHLWMAGLTDSPTATITSVTDVVTNMDYGIYHDGAGVVSTYAAGSYTGSLLTGQIDTAVYTITYDGYLVSLYVNSTLIKTATTTAGRTFYFAFYGNNVGAYVKDVRVGTFVSGARSGINLTDSAGAGLGDAAVKNSAVALTAAGALTGAGGGSILYDSIPNGTTYQKLRATNITAGGLVDYDALTDGSTYARIKATYMTSGQPKLQIGTSGTQIGDARNLPPVRGANLGFKYSGTLSVGTVTTTTAAIAITAGNITAGAATIAYNSMSASITGLSPSTTYTYFFYIVDSTYAGGTKTLQFTTSSLTIYNADANIYMGSATFTTPASGTTSGGDSTYTGGGGCVHAESWIETQTRGWLQARDVLVGDLIKTMGEDGRGWEWNPVLANRIQPENGYEIRSESGIILRCSSSTPLTLEDGSYLPLDKLDGHELPVLDGEEYQFEKCWSEFKGSMPVCYISLGGLVYVAGESRGQGIFTHNVVTPKP
jgi:hypothetical protein